MFSQVNIQNQLLKCRSKRIPTWEIMEEVQKIFAENETGRNRIRKDLKRGNNNKAVDFNFGLLDPDRISHISDIKKLCITYRLRFLDSKFFKPAFPEETITAIHNLERKHSTRIENLKIMAPSKLLKLENADDPLLFAPLGNDFFYLVHKWGKDLHPLRKILMWPYKTFENLVIVVAAISLLLTVFALEIIFETPTIPEYVLTFLFVLKFLGGIVLYYGFAKGKNFNESIWKSRFYNG